MSNAEPSIVAAVDEVTVLEGSSFCRSNRAGDIMFDRPHGMFVKDTRIISHWELTLDDQPLEPLGVLSDEPFAATFLCRSAPRTDWSEPTVVVERRRMIADDVREDIIVRNYGPETLGATLILSVDGDFADLFDVKDGRVGGHHGVRHHATGRDLILSVTRAGHQRGVRVTSPDATATRDALSWRITVPAHGEWRTSVEVLPSVGGEEAVTSFPQDRPVEAAKPSRRMRDWRAARATIECADSALQATIERSFDDLGALRIQDPQHPHLDVVAAGAPWFMALFGRDALLTSWMTLPWDPSLARGTLHTLARLQGRGVDLHSEEEPGKILHEVRLGIDESRALGGSSVYFGSVDSTPLFVMLLAHAARWGLATDDVTALLPAADAAVAWIEHHGDMDGDGFVEYQRKTDRGLINQGWKDSFDAISDAAGRPAQGPIALAEVQGYAYAAFLARAYLAELVDDHATRDRYTEKAQHLREQFNQRFWLPDRGYYALALDGDKRPVDALASNQGHALWTGIADPEYAGAVVYHLLSPDMFSGWGIRTRAAGMGAYNPISYHNGSVWPHDNALIVAGFARYGYYDAAATVATALIEAATAFGGRLPELFCGFSRDEFAAPVPYPTSCSPQAWAAAAPLALLTALLGIEPDRDSGQLRAVNALPPAWGDVRAELSVGSKRAELDSRTLGRPGSSATSAMPA